MYDAIIVGARVAGSAAALQLAQQGHRVLVVDRSEFPSDTVSTHFVTRAGTALLERWGATEALRAHGVPFYDHVLLNVGGNRLSTADLLGANVVCSPRRTHLDATLQDLALARGAELRIGVTATDLLRDADGRVSGVQLRDATGTITEENARVVVGADGKSSVVARHVEPAERHTCPMRAAGTFSYFDNLEWRSAEVTLLDGTFMFVFPTGPKSACVGFAVNEKYDAEIKADPETFFWKVIGQDEELEPRMRVATRDGRWRLIDLPPAWFRHGGGPGWALIGDALTFKDPLPGYGITDAFLSATLVARAIHAGLAGQADLDERLTRYDDAAWELLGPIYMATAEGATYDQNADGMLGVIAGIQGLVAETATVVEAGGPYLDPPVGSASPPA